MSFTAKYRGVCHECGEDILPKQEATYVGHHAEGEIRHYPDCPEDRTAHPREICPRCFMELPVNGICGTCDPE